MEKKIVAFILLSTCDTNLSMQKHYFVNHNSENVWKWVPKLASKFHNDLTIDESGIKGLLGHVLGVCEKRENSV